MIWLDNYQQVICTLAAAMETSLLGRFTTWSMATAGEKIQGKHPPRGSPKLTLGKGTFTFPKIFRVDVYNFSGAKTRSWWHQKIAIARWEVVSKCLTSQETLWNLTVTNFSGKKNWINERGEDDISDFMSILFVGRISCVSYVRRTAPASAPAVCASVSLSGFARTCV